MGLLISKTDFTGKFALSQSITDNITAFITEYEAAYLRDLLGASLYTLFAADVNNSTPQSTIYLSIYNAIAEDSGDVLVKSRGMKKMLLGFIWWEYVRQSKYKHTGTGIVVDSHEVSREGDNSEMFLYSMYNESIYDYKAIQWYICEHKSDYPTFNGQPKGLAWKL